jgi:preprotein translocase subunit SecG
MFGGGSTSTFGSRSGNVLTKTTTVLGALFIITALGLAVLFKTPDTGDVAAAARQAGAKANTEWWNAQPTAPVAQPAAAADATAPAATTAPAAPAKATATPAPAKPAAKN